MKRLLVLLLLSFILTGGTILDLYATEYYYGAIREDRMPDWVLPSPEIPYEGNLNELDEAVDNSEGLPPVGNQSSQGSCTAWASAYYFLTYLQGQDYGWDLTDPAHQCSPAFTYNFINGGSDNGSQPSDAFRLFMDAGCATMEDMPYTAADHNRFPSEDAFYNGIKFRTLQTYQINLRTNNGLNDLKNHIRNGGIAVTAMSVWSNFNNIGNYDDTYCVSEIYGNEPGGHAVTIVGFDESRETSDGTGAYRLVNSWGESWGDDGFFWMSEDALINDRIGWGYALYADDLLEYEPTTVARVSFDHGSRYDLNYAMGLGDSQNPDDYLEYPGFSSWTRESIELIGGTIVLDLTEMDDLINPNQPNNFFLAITDEEGYDPFTGTVNSFIIEDIQTQHLGISREIPIQISNDFQRTYVNAVLQYSVIPPTEISTDLDLSNGEVVISWEEIEESDGFIEYKVFRNDQVVGTTTEGSYTDQLEDFGIYSYYVTSHWEETDSWPTAEVQVNYIEPVTTSFTGVLTVEGETGAYNLAWEMLRDYPITYDNGTSETNICPSVNAQPGTMVAQRFTAPAPGKVVNIGAYFVETNDGMGPVKYAILRTDNNGLPGEVYCETDTFTPDEEGWYWTELTSHKLPVNGEEDFWVAVVWEEIGKSPLGRDLDGEQFHRVSISLDGINWLDRQIPGNPMIRVDYGLQENVDDWTGLLGFKVYMNNENIAYLTSDEHRYQGFLPQPDTYQFRVDAIYQQGTWEGESIQVIWDGSTLDVDEDMLPFAYEVGPAYPNPFNPSTSLNIQLPQNSKVNVEVFNMLGQSVATLVNGEMRAGNHRLSFNASELSSGVYLIRTLVPGQLNNTQKVVFLR